MSIEKKSLLENIKESKKVMDGKLESAATLMEDAAHNFTIECESLIGDASEEEFKELIGSDMFAEGQDETMRLMFLHMYVDTHDDIDFMVVKRPKEDDIEKGKQAEEE